MSAPDSFYTREEVIEARDAAPTRGLWCQKCSTFIPQFSDISAEDERRLLELIRNGRQWMAIQELDAATDCGLGWAKLWVNHRGKPEVFYETPCPYCGQELRSSEAKQCRHCKRDWHDPDNIKTL
jgi:hypothetical protein